MDPLITCEMENRDSKFSVLRASLVVLSSVHHFDDLALKWPITTVRNIFSWVTDSIVRFNLFEKFSTSLAD